MPNQFDDVADAAGQIVETIDQELSALLLAWTKRIIASIKAASKAFTAALSGAVLYNVDALDAAEVVNDLRLAGLAAAVAAVGALGSHTVKDKKATKQ